MIPVLPRLPTQLTRVKTAVSFTAEDPWKKNRLSTFRVDDYMVTLRGTKSLPAGAQELRWLGGFHRALRSEVDSVTRFLPESLIELWMTRQVTTEALPGLLHEIESTLKKSDFKPMLRSTLMTALAVTETIVCALIVLIAVIGVVLGHLPLWIAAGVVLGTAFVCWGFLYLVYFEKLFRRKRQMRWLLERIHAHRDRNTVQWQQTRR